MRWRRFARFRRKSKKDVVPKRQLKHEQRPRLKNRLDSRKKSVSELSKRSAVETTSSGSI